MSDAEIATERGRAGAYAGKFTGTYEHRVIDGGIGHNLPQEVPTPSPRRSST